MSNMQPVVHFEIPVNKKNGQTHFTSLYLNRIYKKCQMETKVIPLPLPFM